jgi:hypothetical protein
VQQDDEPGAALQHLRCCARSWGCRACSPCSALSPGAPIPSLCTPRPLSGTQQAASPSLPFTTLAAPRAPPPQALRACDFRRAQDIWSTMQQRHISPDMETLKAFLRCAPAPARLPGLLWGRGCACACVPVWAALGLWVRLRLRACLGCSGAAHCELGCWHCRLLGVRAAAAWGKLVAGACCGPGMQHRRLRRCCAGSRPAHAPAAAGGPALPLNRRAPRASPPPPPLPALQVRAQGGRLLRRGARHRARHVWCWQHPRRRHRAALHARDGGPVRDDRAGRGLGAVRRRRRGRRVSPGARHVPARQHPASRGGPTQGLWEGRWAGRAGLGWAGLGRARCRFKLTQQAD